MAEKTQVTCSKCNRTYVPSFAFDFYPDGNDPEKGLCERCMLAEAFAKETPKDSPSPLPPGYLEAVCKLGQGEKACSFLMHDGSNPSCAKGSGFEIIIRQRRAEGSIRSRGDNCSGPPEFKRTRARKPAEKK